MPNTPKPGAYVGTREAASMLGYTTRQVQRMVARGELAPAVSAPGGPYGSFMFKRADIEAAKDAQ